jgi:hypothetical protein
MRNAGAPGNGAERQSLDPLLCQEFERSLDQPIAQRRLKIFDRGLIHVDSVY